MTHDTDCLCRECKRRASAPPSSRITIPLADIPTVIAESVRAVLDSHGMGVHRMTSRSFVTSVDTSELDALLNEIGRNTAGALQGLDESPIEEPMPAPAAVRRRGVRR